MVKRYTKLLLTISLLLTLSSCGGESVDFERVTPNSNDIEEALVVEETPVVETNIPEPIEPVIPEPVTPEPVVEDPVVKKELSDYKLELISSNRVEVVEGYDSSLDFRVVDGSDVYTESLDNYIISFSSSESTVKVSGIKQNSNGTISLNFVGEESGESIVTIIYTENPTSEVSILVKVVPESEESKLKLFCKVDDDNSYDSISDINSGDGLATQNSYISINSRVPTFSDSEESRVTLLYRDIELSSTESFATKTLFFRDPTNRLVATIGYSKSLVGVNFYLIYKNSDGDEVCTEMTTFPTSAVLESGGDKIEIAEQMPTIGEIE